MIGLSYPHMIIDFWTRGKMMLLTLAADCGSGHEQPRNDPKVRAADEPPTDRWTVNSEPLLSIYPRGPTPKNASGILCYRAGHEKSLRIVWCIVRGPALCRSANGLTKG